MSRPPMGANMMPMMNRVGRTVFGVRIGCHALRRCCLKAVSLTDSQLHTMPGLDVLTCRTPPAALFLWRVYILSFLSIEKTHGSSSLSSLSVSRWKALLSGTVSSPLMSSLLIMVSSLLPDALANPTAVLLDLFQSSHDLDRFPSTVTTYFADIFSTKDALNEVIYYFRTLNNPHPQ
jgi:hypothetical protein